MADVGADGDNSLFVGSAPGQATISAVTTVGNGAELALLLTGREASDRAGFAGLEVALSGRTAARAAVSFRVLPGARRAGSAEPAREAMHDAVQLNRRSAPVRTSVRSSIGTQGLPSRRASPDDALQHG